MTWAVSVRDATVLVSGREERHILLKELEISMD